MIWRLGRYAIYLLWAGFWDSAEIDPRRRYTRYSTVPLVGCTAMGRAELFKQNLSPNLSSNESDYCISSLYETLHAHPDIMRTILVPKRMPQNLEIIPARPQPERLPVTKISKPRAQRAQATDKHKLWCRRNELTCRLSRLLETFWHG